MTNTQSHNSFLSTPDLYAGSLLIIDKPVGWTSFDVVNKLKWFITRKLPRPAEAGDRRFKIGHAGTLDPLASGMLILCTGAKTKEIQSIQDGRKIYTGTFFIGKTTPSYDLETEPEGEYRTEHIHENLLIQTAQSFLGEQLQMPPAFSAKWVDGKRAYESARRGESISLRRAMIEIFDFRITRIELPEVDFILEVSKGTYIRSIAHDFGQRLGSGAYLHSLRRTACFPFTEGDMIQLDEALAILARIAEDAPPEPPLNQGI